MPKPGEQIGRYHLLRCIGKGGMGEVWLANTALGETFAIKMPFETHVRNESFRRAFYREAAAQLNLRHEHIVPAFDFIDTNGILGLVLQYVPGTTLEARVYGPMLDEVRTTQGQPLPLDESLEIGIAVLDALDFAHQNNWIHRDVKGSNILLEQKTGRPYLTDFGIVVNLASRRTTTGAVAGTVWYMSPEHIRSPSKVDHRTDVYSFGCILYEMLTGRAPFDVDPGEEGDADYIIKSKHLTETPPRPSTLNGEIPQPLENIILSALEKKPEDRLSGCGEFRDALRDCLTDYRAPQVHTGTTTETHGSSAATSSRPSALTSPPLDSSSPSPHPVVTEPRKPAGRMFATAAGIIAFLVLTGVVIAFSNRDMSEQEWRGLNHDDVPAIQRFIDKYPQSPHHTDARRLLADARDRSAWKVWKDWPKDTEESVQRYLREHPSEAPRADAEKRLAHLRASKPAEPPPVPPDTEPAPAPAPAVVPGFDASVPSRPIHAEPPPANSPVKAASDPGMARSTPPVPARGDLFVKRSHFQVDQRFSRIV